MKPVKHLNIVTIPIERYDELLSWKIKYDQLAEWYNDLVINGGKEHVEKAAKKEVVEKFRIAPRTHSEQDIVLQEAETIIRGEPVEVDQPPRVRLKITAAPLPSVPPIKVQPGKHNCFKTWDHENTIPVSFTVFTKRHLAIQRTIKNMDGGFVCETENNGRTTQLDSSSLLKLKTAIEQIIYQHQYWGSRVEINSTKPLEWFQKLIEA